jgi:hypothetical protein
MLAGATIIRMNNMLAMFCFLVKENWKKKKTKQNKKTNR